MKTKIFFLLLGLTIGVMVSWMIGNHTKHNLSLNQQSTMHPSNYGSNELDRYFIEEMIPHHEDAITMATLATTLAKRQEIKTLASDILNLQSKEIDTMKAWYKTWYGKDVSQKSKNTSENIHMDHSNLHMGVMGNQSDVYRLKDASDFDKAFIEHMIPHHQMAVMMAQMLEQGSNRLEMKTLAKDIISAQTKEINLMREWLKSWK